MTLHDELAGRLKAAAALLTRTGNGDLAVSVLNAADEVKRLRAENERLTLTVRKLQGNQAALEAELKGSQQ